MTGKNNLQLVDNLVSLTGNLGNIERDKNAGTFYATPFIDDIQLVNAYRSSWLARKIVDIPVKDTLRAGRNWFAEKDQIEKIENEEKRLRLDTVQYLAKTRGRLFGGGAIFIGTDQDASTPLDPQSIKLGGVRYLTALTRVQLKADVNDLDQDPLSEFYKRPRMYTVFSGMSERRVHASRLAIFIDTPAPEIDLPFGWSVGMHTGWGDSCLLPVWRALRNADVAPDLMVSLLHEANVDVFGVPDFLENVADPQYEQRMLKRWMLAATSKGINGTLLMDAAETYERKGVTFGGAADILDRALQIASGAADIPMTRFYGQSPGGMNSTGDSDTRNYYDRLSGDQELFDRPAMSRLFECIVRSALGSYPAEIYYRYAPLWQMSAKELADIGKIHAETANTLNNTGLISSEALSTVVVTQFSESGFYPGIDEATDDAPIDFDKLAADEEEARQASLAAQKQPITDAAPKPLYVHRAVKNASAIVAWAKSQGFASTLEPSDMHVTIIFSRAPIDWMKVGEAWSAELKLPAGGPRVIEQFKRATVLSFASRELQWRHVQGEEAGASWDHEQYQPHITITYAAGDVDIDKIEPYRGEIILGPEIFTVIDEDWSDTKVERPT